MPLRAAPGAPRPEQNYMRFVMQDTHHGGVVVCRISEEALRKLSGSPVSCMQSMFERCHREAEQLASARYDAGQGCPVVMPNDVRQIKVRSVGDRSPISFGSAKLT